VDNVKPELPAAADSPQVVEASFSSQPVLELSIFADRQLSDLGTYAEDLQTALERIPNVSSANIIGGLTKEYNIILDPQKLQNLGISQDQIIGAIQASNLNFPIGSLTVDGFNYSLRVENRYDGIQDLLDLPVGYIKDAPLALREVATIGEVYPEQKIFSYVSINGQDSRQAISLAVVKKTGGSIFDVVKEAKQTIQDFEDNVLPDDVQIEIVTDYSVYIEDSVNILVSSGQQTIILVFILLLLVLGAKEAFLAGLAIPLSFLLALGLMSSTGATINSLTLFSLVLGLGLLIDNAIVIVEGCYDYVSKGHYTPYEAAILAVRDFKYPLFSGTLTTVSAFLPMLLTTGIVGQFIKWIPLTITFVLMGSLFIALTIIPTFARLFLKKYSPKETKGMVHRVVKVKQGLWHGIENFYAKTIETVLKRKMFRRLIVLGVVVAFLAVMVLPFAGILRAELFPRTDQDLFYITAELPAGSAIEKTVEVARKIETFVREVPELDNYLMSMGYNSGVSDSSAIVLSGRDNSNYASFTVNLVKNEERERTSTEITDELRQKVKDIQGAKMLVTEITEGPPSGAPIEVRLYGDNLDDLIETVTDFENMLTNEVPGAVDVTTSYRQTAGEFVIRIDNNKAAYFGLTAQQVATVLRTAVSGFTISDILEDGDEIDIVLKYDESKIESISDFNNIPVINRSGDAVPLSNVVEISVESGIESIRHNDQKRYFTVTSYATPGVLPNDVTQAFLKEIENYPMPRGVTYEVGGETEDITESFTSLFLSMILAVFLIFLILILQFDSFVQPFIIIFAVPMSMIGVIPGLLITGNALSFPAFLGVVGLAGIVVNNGIILIDKMNINKKQYDNLIEGFVEAGKSRVQPVILTTLTTILGMVPLSYSDPFWAPLSISIIFGISVATFLTLVIVPILNYGVEQRKIKKERKRELKALKKEQKQALSPA
jgi:HAE1 family hydrophobic/amphiphilic exporter-1